MPYRRYRTPYRRRRYGYGQKKLRVVPKRGVLRKRTAVPVTGIPLIKRMKFKKEILVNFNPATYTMGTTGYGSLLCIPCQNPNPGGTNYFRTDSITSYYSDLQGCAGLTEWFQFYNSLFVRGCKAKLELVNNTADPLMVDIFPTIGWYAANPLGDGTTTFESYQIDPSELPMSSRTFMGGANSQNKATIKKYVNVRKMLGVKDLEDVLNAEPQEESADNTLYTPRVPIITSSSDTSGQTPSTGTLWINVLFRDPNFNAGYILPNPTVRLVVTYYVEYRSRKTLTGANSS